MGEEQIKLEGEIAAKNRELKYKTIEVDGLKRTIAELISIKETNEKLISEQKDELTQTMNTISDARLNWSTEKAEQLADIEEMRKGVKGILDKEVDLIKKEADITAKIEQEVAIRNENSQALLDIETAKVALGFRENTIEEEKSKLSAKNKEVDGKIAAFKEKVIHVMGEVKEL